MKVLTVVGARPRFVKAACVSRALRGRGWTDSLAEPCRALTCRRRAAAARG